MASEAVWLAALNALGHQSASALTAEQLFEMREAPKKIVAIVQQCSHSQQEHEQAMNSLTQQINQLSADLENSLKQHKHEMARCKSLMEEQSCQLSSHKQRLELLSVERDELQRALDRKLAEKASIEGEHDRLIRLINKLRQDYSSADDKLMECEREKCRLDFELSRCKALTEQHRDRSEWTQQELDKVLVEISNFRKSKSEEIVRLNSALQDKCSELDNIKILFKKCKSDLESAKCDNAAITQKYDELKASSIQSTAEFEAEMQAKQQSLDLYQRAAHEAELKICELQEVIQAQSCEVEKHKYIEKPVNVVFSENSQLRQELSVLKAENDRLRDCLEEVCGEIDSRAPLLNQERKENDRLKKEILVVTSQLMSVTKERDSLSHNNVQNGNELEQLSSENRAHRLVIKDLNKQVQLLLKQLDSHSAAIVPSAFSDCNDDVVVFRSVEELQLKNAELLERMRLLEGNKRSLDCALLEIDQLKESRTKQSALLESLMAQKISPKMEVPRDFSDLKTKLVKLESTCQQQQSQIHSMQQQQIEERSQLQKQISELSTVNMSMQSQVQSAMNDMFSAKERQQLAEMAARRQESDLCALRVNEEKALAELSSLKLENERISRLSSQLQSAIYSQQESANEQRDRLSKQIDMLEKDVGMTRKRLGEQIELHNSSVAMFERDRKEWLAKQEQFASEISLLKSDQSKAVDVDYYKSALRSTERALEEVGKRWDEYRLACANQKNTDESDALKLQLGEVRDKLQAFVMIETELQQSFGIRASQVVDYLSNNASLLSELESKIGEYESSKQESAALIDRQSETIARLSEEIACDREELGKALSDRDSIQQQCIELKLKLSEVERQNDHFLSNIVTDEDYGEVIKYLRREKDVLERDKLQLEEEKAILQASYDSTMTLLANRTGSNTAKEQADPADDHGLVSQLTSKCQQLKDVNRELRTNYATIQQECKLLSDDRQVWKQRCTDATTSLDAVRGECDVLKSHNQELSERLANVEQRNKKILEKYQAIKASLDHIQQVQAVSQQDSSQMQVIASDLNECRQQLQEALNVNDALTKSLAERDLKVTKLTAILQKYKSIRKDFELAKQACIDNISSLKERVSDAEKEQELHRTALTSQWKSKLEKLQKEVNRSRHDGDSSHDISHIASSNISASALHSESHNLDASNEVLSDSAHVSAKNGESPIVHEQGNIPLLMDAPSAHDVLQSQKHLMNDNEGSEGVTKREKLSSEDDAHDMDEYVNYNEGLEDDDDDEYIDDINDDAMEQPLKLEEKPRPRCTLSSCNSL